MRPSYPLSFCLDLPSMLIIDPQDVAPPLFYDLNSFSLTNQFFMLFFTLILHFPFLLSNQQLFEQQRPKFCLTLTLFFVDYQLMYYSMIIILCFIIRAWLIRLQIDQIGLAIKLIKDFAYFLMPLLLHLLLYQKYSTTELLRILKVIKMLSTLYDCLKCNT